MTTMSSHIKRTEELAAKVKQFHAAKQPFRIYNGSTNSTRPNHQGKTIDISGLSNILEIDSKQQFAVVEPNVPMDKLVEATLKHNLIPPVVMEFPGITVGGGFAGSAGESSSFKYGYFDQTIRSVEILLADGRLVKASATENAELFAGAAGALGTIGIVTLLEVNLIKAKKYVKCTYKKTNTVKEAVYTIQEATRDVQNDYVDGILFSQTHGAIITGELTDEEPTTKQCATFSGPWDPWYYLHVQKATKYTSEPVTEYVPLAEYLFRYDRGGFWVGCEAFRYFPFIPFNRFTRWFLDDFMHTRMLYRALHGSGSSFEVMIQDLSLPYSTVEDFLDHTSEELGIWPIWLCPLKEINGPSFDPHTTLPGPEENAKPMLNIGLWGRASKDVDCFVKQNRSLEKKLSDLGGRKVLYSHTFYTEDEFWKIYDRQWYEGLRKRYSATYLPSVFDKVRVTPAPETRNQPVWPKSVLSSWPYPGIQGIRRAIKSKEYFLHRNAAWAFSRISEATAATSFEKLRV